MMTAYGLLKLVHVLAAIVWIGGSTALSVTSIRMARASDRDGLASLLPLAARYGQRMAGPSSILVLLSGIAMVSVGRLGFPFWVQVGFTGLVLHLLIGATLLRRNGRQLGALVSAQDFDPAAFAAVARRGRNTTAVYLSVMILVIAAMVLKPTL